MSNAREYIEQWLGGRLSRTKAEKVRTRWSVQHDRWDDKARKQVQDSVPEFQVNAKQLGRLAPGSGETLFGDAFHALYKAKPTQTPRGEMRPTHLVNHSVMEEVLGGPDGETLPEYERLWRLTCMDKVGAAQADIELRPHLEEIMDRLKQAQDQANQMQQQMEDHDDLAGALLEMLQQQGSSGGKSEDEDSEGEGGDGSDEGEGEGQVIPGSGSGGEQLSEEELQEQIEKLQEQLRQLEEQMLETADKLDQELNDAKGDVRIGLGQAMDAANEELSDQADASMMFGEDPGALRHMDPEKRIRIAKAMETDKFRAIAKLLGKMQPFALGEQCKKVDRIPEEVVDITVGNDLSRVLPLELARIADPVQRVLALRRFRDRQMMQYRMRGTERLAQGDIIVCEDGSGSMTGIREIFSKALTITLGKVAHEQKRSFTGIHFGSRSELTTFHFDNSGGAWGEESSVRRETEGAYSKTYPDCEMSYVEGIINFAELFYGGGTDFETPLAKALSILQKQHDETGATRGDIVFVSDGYCAVSKEFMEMFIAERERLDFRVWGLIIGAPIQEPLISLCNGDTFSLTDLTDGSELASLFQRI